MNCISGNDSGNTPTLCTVKIVKARKPYFCCECKNEIMPGERYEHVSGLWDGEWAVYHTCLPCSRIREDLLCDWTYGELFETLREALYESGDYDDEHCWIEG